MEGIWQTLGGQSKDLCSLEMTQSKCGDFPPPVHTYTQVHACTCTHTLSVTLRAVELLQVCVTAVWQCVPYLCVSFSRSISDCKLPERRNWAYKSLYKASECLREAENESMIS